MPTQPTILIFTTLLILLSASSLFLFPNVMYYTLNLLVFVFITLSLLFFSGVLSSLTILILLIVYVGAIIILIGYVCAVCPNVNFSSNTNFMFPILSLILFIFLGSSSYFNTSSVNLVPTLHFFYRSFGFGLFILLVFMLFVILLVVTSYYVSPKGPFRSVS